MVAAMATKRDRTSDYFARATRRLMRRCDQICHRYGADLYILVRRDYRHFEYNSTKDPAFPTTPPELVSAPVIIYFSMADSPAGKGLPARCKEVAGRFSKGREWLGQDGHM